MKSFFLFFIFLFCTAVSLSAQKQHLFYAGTNYRFIHENHPWPKLTYEDAMRGLSTGRQGNLNHDVLVIPLPSIGYLYKRNLRKHPEFGFYIGAELNSVFGRSQVKMDEGYYEYYSWWGFYPSTSIVRNTRITGYLNTGINYKIKKFVFYGGLSISCLDIYINNNSNKANLSFEFESLAHLRCSFNFYKKLSIYSDVRTTIRKEYYTSPYYVGLGVQWSTTEKVLPRKKRR